MSLDPKYIRKRSTMISTPLIDVDLDANRDVLGEIFAARDQAKREQRFADRLSIKCQPTRPAGTPVSVKPRPIIPLQKSTSTTRLIQERNSQPPQPIKPIERVSNPFTDRYKDGMEALFERINRVIGSTPNQQPDTDSSNE